MFLFIWRHRQKSYTSIFAAEANVDNINPSDVNLQAAASSNEEPATNQSSELPVSEPHEYVKQKEGCQLTAQLRILLYHFVARPVVYARWFVAGEWLFLSYEKQYINILEILRIW